MIEIKKFSESNSSEFINNLSEILAKKFNCEVQDLPDNYNKKCQWGLLYLLENGSLDDYYLMFRQGRIWAGIGGIIRFYDNQKIYQAAFRGFSCASEQYKSLGMKTLVHKYITAEQIEIARKKSCDKVIMSFNEHNHRLFEITHRYIMPRACPEIKWEISEQPVIFNHVPQWLMMHRFS